VEPGRVLARPSPSGCGMCSSSTAETVWQVKSHPGNERTTFWPAKRAWSPQSLAFLRLRIPEVQAGMASRSGQPATEDIIPPSKKSCMDYARNAVAGVAAQIRTGHWRPAVFLKQIRQHRNDHCWFRNGRRTMTVTPLTTPQQRPTSGIPASSLGGTRAKQPAGFSS
jgi:hypothetical protein